MKKYRATYNISSLDKEFEAITEDHAILLATNGLKPGEVLISVSEI